MPPTPGASSRSWSPSTGWRCCSGWSSGSAGRPGWPRCWWSTTRRPTARGSGWPGRRPATSAGAHPARRNRGGAGGFHEGLRLGRRARRRPGLADGRRRPARARLPRAGCSSTTATSTSGARSSSTRPTRTGWSSRSGCPAAPASCTGWPTSSAAADDGRDPRRRDPVQRRAGHPRAGRADRAAPRGVLHLGRRPRVPPARRARPAPGSPPSSTPRSATPASATSARR